MSALTAFALAKRGFRVFPLMKNGKRPVREGWTEYATNDPIEALDLFCRVWDRDGTAYDLPGCQGYNVGVLTDGMVVVDVDNKPERQGWQDFARLDPDLDTFTVETPSGGRHYYFNTCGASFSNTNDDKDIGRGVDTRSWHGYVVGPGSVVDGQEYRVLHDPIPLADREPHMADAPAKLLIKLKPPRHDRKAASVDFEFLDDPRCIAHAVQTICSTPGATEGTQSDDAYNIGCVMRDCGVSEDMATEILLEFWNPKCSPPLSDDDMAMRVANAYAYSRDVPGNRSALLHFAGIDTSAFTQFQNDNAAPVSSTGAALVGRGQDTDDDDFDPLGNAPPLESLHKRPWLVKGLLMCGEAGLLGGAGSSGKTNLMLAIALHLAAGAPTVLGYENPNAGRPVKSLLYTAEDRMNEIGLRLHGACLIYGFDFEQVRPHLSIIAGVDMPKHRLRIARIGEHGAPVEETESVARFLKKVAKHDYGLIAADPLINLHSLNENDASHAQYLGEFFNELAARTNAAVMVTHHTTKAGDAGVANLRGSGALSASVRSALVWSRLAPEEALALGLSEKEAARVSYIADGKQNAVEKTGKRRYFIMQSANLSNGESVGVPVPYDIEQKKSTVEENTATRLRAHMDANTLTNITTREAVLYFRENLRDDMFLKWKITDAEALIRRAAIASEFLAIREGRVVLPDRMAANDPLAPPIRVEFDRPFISTG